MAVTWKRVLFEDDAALGDVTGTSLTLSGLTASLPVFTTAAKKLASNTMTGTGSVVMSTSPSLVTPLLGTPTSGTLTNCTGLPIATGVSGLGANMAAWLADPTSAKLATAVTDETGSGALVFGTSPTLTTPVINVGSDADGDTYYRASGLFSRLAKGTAYQHLGMNSGATAPEWQASVNSTLTAQGDIPYASAANTLARLAKGTAGQVLTMNSGATAPEWGSVASGLPLGYLSGLTIAHAADTEHDITVAAGEARDATDAADMVLASAITKRFDAEWAVGSTEGGMASGESLPASGTIHIWLIKRSDTGVVDVMANNHATTGLTPTLPANYDYKRRIFSLRTDASNNIINGDQWGTGLIRRFLYDTPILDYENANPGANAATVALSVPGGIIVSANVNVHLIYVSSASGTRFTYLSSLANTDLAPANNAAPLATYSDAYRGSGAGIGYGVVTNTSSQIRFRQNTNVNNEYVRIATIGWEDSL